MATGVGFIAIQKKKYPNFLQSLPSFYSCVEINKIYLPTIIFYVKTIALST